LKISSVAFGKCREEYHYFFAPTSAGRSLRFCEKKRITRAKTQRRKEGMEGCLPKASSARRKKEYPPRRTGRVYADLSRKKPQIRRLSQKDLLHLREKKSLPRQA